MESKTRIGSGFTTMLFQEPAAGLPAAALQDTPPTPVASAQAVQPIDESVPLEIVTAMAVGVGTLRCSFYELWNFPVWSALPGLQGTPQPAGCPQAPDQPGQYLHAEGHRRRPASCGPRSSTTWSSPTWTRGNVNIGTMTIPRTLTFQYC